MADELLDALGRRQREAPVSEDTAGDEGAPAEAALLDPFEGDERAALLDAVFAEVDDRAEPSDQPSDQPREEAAESGSSAEPAAAPVVDLASRRRLLRPAVGAVVAIAAALLLWLGVFRPPAPGSDGHPVYAATRLDGAVATMRSGDSKVPTALELAPDGSIDWVFTPEAPVRRAVAVALVAVPEHGEAVVARPTAETSDEGVVRVSGRLADVLPLPAGTWTVHVLLGEPSALPAASPTDLDGDWSRVTLEVKITSDR